ncbi:MAG TPA: hypothetical protein VGN16_18360 [Acidobacteriaceae bacterium]|jgi:hypothetical protein
MVQRLFEIARRQSIFDKFTVRGILYRGGDTETLFWHVTVTPPMRLNHDFWVEGEKFYAVGLHIFDPAMGGESHIDRLGEIEDVPADMRAVVLEAIDMWSRGEPDESLIEIVLKLLPDHPTIESLQETDDLRDLPASDIRYALRILESRGKLAPGELFGRDRVS